MVSKEDSITNNNIVKNRKEYLLDSLRTELKKQGILPHKKIVKSDDSVYTRINNKYFVFKKNPNFREYKKMHGHPGLIRFRNYSCPEGYLLFDSLGNKIIEQELTEINPFINLDFTKIDKSHYSNLVTNHPSRNFYGCKHYLIDRELSEAEKYEYHPNKLIPNYANDLEPVYLDVFQSVRVGGKTLPYRWNESIIVIYQLAIRNKDLFLIKNLVICEIFDKNHELRASIYFDDISYLDSPFMSKNKKYIIIPVGGEVCCEGEGYLQMPHYRVYDIDTEELIHQSNNIPEEFINK